MKNFSNHQQDNINIRFRNPVEINNKKKLLIKNLMNF